MSTDVAQWVALAASAVALTFAVRANRLSAAYADEAEAHADRAEEELRWMLDQDPVAGAAVMAAMAERSATPAAPATRRRRDRSST